MLRECVGISTELTVVPESSSIFLSPSYHKPMLTQSEASVSPVGDTPCAHSGEIPLEHTEPPGSMESISSASITPTATADLPLQTSGPSEPPPPVIRCDEDKANDAIISINSIDIFKPPLKILFNTINPRKLRPSGVKNLVDSIRCMFTPYKSDSMFRILLNKEDIDPSCIDVAGKSYRTKVLKLSAVGLAKNSFIIACGGSHRYEAVTRIVKDLEKELVGLRKTLANLKDAEEKKALGAAKKGKGGRKAKGKGKGNNVDTDDEDGGPANVADEDGDPDGGDNGLPHSTKTLGEVPTIQGIEALIKLADGKIQQYSTWGVCVYDSSMFFLMNN